MRNDYRTLGGASLEEIALEEGISVQAVRQIEVKALRKLRQFCKIRGINVADLLPAKPETHYEGFGIEW